MFCVHVSNVMLRHTVLIKWVRQCKPLGARHAGERHGMCELALKQPGNFAVQ
jgi:hypothetical protein